MNNMTKEELKEKLEEIQAKKREEMELFKNGEGYPDPTAYQAIKNADSQNHCLVTEVKREPKPQLKDDERFYKTLHSIFHVLELGGFDLEGRITLVDKRTGKVWR